MESLVELYDLIAEHPSLFSKKLSRICDRSPPPESLLSGSSRVTRVQLNALLVVARIVSKCPDYADLKPKSVVLKFLRSIPTSFDRSFWPQSFGNDLIASFFSDFLGHMSKATESSADFATEIVGFSGEVVSSVISNGGEDLGVSKAFLMAQSENFPPILPHDEEKLIAMLIDQFVVVSGNVVQSPVTLRGQTAVAGNSENSPAQS